MFLPSVLGFLRDSVLPRLDKGSNVLSFTHPAPGTRTSLSNRSYSRVLRNYACLRPMRAFLRPDTSKRVPDCWN